MILFNNFMGNYIGSHERAISAAWIKEAREDRKKFLFDRAYVMTGSTSGDYSLTFDSLLRGQPYLRQAGEPLVQKRPNPIIEITQAFITDVTNLWHPTPNRLRQLVEWKKLEKEVWCLDLMSYGAALKDLGVNGCSVGLSDRRSVNRISAEEAPHNLSFIDGDLRLHRTWRAIQRRLQENGDKKLDFVFCHPGGGLEHIPPEMIYYEYVFGNIYPLLDVNGIFLTEFHDEMYPFVEEAVRKLNRVPGIKALCDYRESTFMLIRNPKAPDRLSYEITY